VSNLTWRTSWQDLKDHFKQAGKGGFLDSILHTCGLLAATSLSEITVQRRYSNLGFVRAVAYVDILRERDGRSKVSLSRGDQHGKKGELERQQHSLQTMSSPERELSQRPEASAISGTAGLLQLS
jgi:RNA recognition motif-containing protein